MRFLSAAQRCKYVVTPSYRVMNGASPETHKGLTARFLNHAFDSEKAQRDLGWTDEDRRKVESHLLTHPDFDRQGGIFLDEVVEGKTHKPAHGATVRCIAFFRNEAGESEQCPNEAEAGQDYCADHAPAEVGADKE